MKIHTVATEDTTRPEERSAPSPAQQPGTRSTGREMALTPERLKEIRQRIRSGYYDSEHVIDTVARRILEADDSDG